jgi:ubiquinol-cytochrome c reductase cytochrome c1 subunit
MITKAVIRIVSLAAMLAASFPAFSAGGGPLERASINIRDTAAIQRGAKWYVNYCFSCHSASYMRYKRLSQDLGLDEDLVQTNLVFADAKLGDTMQVAMRPADAEAWLGKVPPDLSLIARSRGADWLFTYMKTFYRDDSGGWNNLMLPNASMPHVMWELQGIQVPVWSTHDDGHGEQAVIDHLTLTQPGLQSPEEYEKTVRDLVTFLEYLSEPSEVKRKNVGIWVILFLVLFAGISYLLKAEYWRDVH